MVEALQVLPTLRIGHSAVSDRQVPVTWYSYTRICGSRVPMVVGYGMGSGDINGRDYHGRCCPSVLCSFDVGLPRTACHGRFFVDDLNIDCSHNGLALWSGRWIGSASIRT